MLSARMLALCCLAVASCQADSDAPAGPLKVEVVHSENGFQILRGGNPYEIKGAGLEFGDIASFAAHGGNTIRNWTTRNDVETAQEVLDRAHANGVTVLLCLPMQAERWGFDYDDTRAVASQLEDFRGEVVKYRDHPALLGWIIGNELNWDYTNPKVYDAVNDVSRMIHELDPNHPTTTTVAGVGEDVVHDIQTRAPDIDFVSFQVYGEIFVLPELIGQMGFDAPFMVTEWGAVGYWEVDKTTWGAPIEATSSQKAEIYRSAYRDKLETLGDQLIGSFVFLWGQKQERTPTWFGLFTEAGEKTETIDVMHHIWNDSWPENRAPQVRLITLDDEKPESSVTLTADSTYEAVVDIVDIDGDELVYRWELKRESDSTQAGGDYEESLANLTGLIENVNSPRTPIRAPESGEYRLFVYAYDGQGHAAHANVPFLVLDKTDD
jgi:hypothetical protein